MATKQEMEAEIAALKAKVDELQSLSPEAVKANLGPAVEAELTKLREDVSKLAQERDDLQKSVDDLKVEAAEHAQEFADIHDELEKLKAQLSAAPVLEGNAVVWEGSSKEILYHGGLRDLLEQYKRRNVEDGWLALVVKHPY